MLGIVIVLFNAFADFCSGDSNNRICIGVVIRQAIKDLDSEDSLLQVLSMALQRASHHEPQKLCVALTGMKKRTATAAPAVAELLLFCFAGRSPALNDGLRYQSAPALR